MKKNMVFIIIAAFLLHIGLAHGAVNTTYAGLHGVLSVSLVNQDPDPAITGDVVEVRLGMENLGGTALENMVVEIVPSYPFTLAPGENAVQNIGTLQGFQQQENMQIVKYTLKVDRDATAGSYEFKVKAYQQGSAAMIQTGLSIDIQSQESAEIIHIGRTALVPGEQSSLKFTIDNVGNSPLRELTFSWENDDDVILPVGSDNTKYIKYIDVGGSADLEYQVIADTNADPGLYKLNLHLTYQDSVSNTDKTITTQAGLYVGGGTDFDVAFSQNANGQMSFTVANIGSNPAYSVAVSIPTQRAWRVTGSNTNIVGNLNKGDYTVASFAVQSTASMNRTGMTGTPGAIGASDQRQTAPGQITQGQYAQGLPSDQNETGQFLRQNSTSNTILLHIAYTDTMGIRQVLDKEVIVGSQASTAAGTGFSGRQATQTNVFVKYKWYFISFAVLLVGYIVYRKVRKKSLLDQEMKVQKRK
ncbi:MAG: COG1361 S-layer family protein [Nanoarchaeota archaeon]